jgi:dephospho-CoA kinase
MITIGITGSIGSGKSTVSRMFHQLGGCIIDADEVAQQVMAPFRPAWWAVCEYFGQGIIYMDTSEINRAKLGAFVFRDSFLLQKLNSQVHPLIIKEINDQLDQLRSRGGKLAVVDVPLLIEAGMHHHVDFVVVVCAEQDIQIARLRNRYTWLTTQDIIQRINSQMSLEAKKKYADFVIDNNENLEQTRQQVQRVFREVMKEQGR